MAKVVRKTQLCIGQSKVKYFQSCLLIEQTTLKIVTVD